MSTVATVYKLTVVIAKYEACCCSHFCFIINIYHFLTHCSLEAFIIFSPAPRIGSLFFFDIIRRLQIPTKFLTFYNQSKPSHSSIISILIISLHLRLGSPSPLFPLVFPQNPYVHCRSPSCVPQASPFLPHWIHHIDNIL